MAKETLFLKALLKVNITVRMITAININKPDNKKIGLGKTSWVLMLTLRFKGKSDLKV
jgi:hypothetical protein